MADILAMVIVLIAGQVYLMGAVTVLYIALNDDEVKDSLKSPDEKWGMIASLVFGTIFWPIIFILVKIFDGRRPT